MSQSWEEIMMGLTDDQMETWFGHIYRYLRSVERVARFNKDHHIPTASDFAEASRNAVIAMVGEDLWLAHSVMCTFQKAFDANVKAPAFSDWKKDVERHMSQEMAPALAGLSELFEALGSVRVIRLRMEQES